MEERPPPESTTSPLQSLAGTGGSASPERTERQALTNQDLLQTTLDSSPYYVQVFEAIRAADGKIVDFTWILQNRKYTDLYGYQVGKRMLLHSPDA